MREVRFRAKRRHWNEFKGWEKWIYAHGYYFDGINYWFITPSKDNPALAWAKNEIIDIETLSEYTGLYDCKYKEIWEGDILNVWNGVVIFDPEAACFRVKMQKEGYTEYLHLSKVLTYYQIEVISNTFENPELLGGIDDKRT